MKPRTRRMGRLANLESTRASYLAAATRPKSSGGSQDSPASARPALAVAPETLLTGSLPSGSACGTCKCVYPSSCIGQALNVMRGSRCFRGFGTCGCAELSLGCVGKLLSVGCIVFGAVGVGSVVGLVSVGAAEVIGGGRGARPLVASDGIVDRQQDPTGVLPN